MSVILPTHLAPPKIQSSRNSCVMAVSERGGASFLGFPFCRGAFLWLCLFLANVSHNWSVEAAGKYDVCGEPKAVKKGDSMDIGFVFWPNATLNDWGGIDKDRIIPCNDRESLIQGGAQGSFFRVKVDELTVMITSDQFHDKLQAPSRGDKEYQVSVVAFKGTFRSSPRLISYVGADGKQELVDSLTLVARFDEGKLRDLQWFDFGCGECFTDEKAICLRRQGQVSCAVSKCPDGESCPTSMHIVFEGSDKNSEVFASAKQIRSLRKASVEDIYKSGQKFASDVVSQASSAADNVG